MLADVGRCWSMFVEHCLASFRAAGRRERVIESVSLVIDSLTLSLLVESPFSDRELL